MPIQSFNPYTNQLEKSFTPMSANDVHQAIAAAEKAFQSWRDTPHSKRSKLMMNVANRLRENPEKYARLMTLEMGKLFREGVDWEIPNCADMCEYYAKNAADFLRPDNIEENVDGEAHMEYHPLGPIFGVMPWNFPFYQVIRFAVPAIMAGNVALFKHASSVPQCALALEQLFLDAGFPKGVLTYLPIPPSEADTEFVIRDERIRGVSLTGSEKAGVVIAELAGKYLKKCLMELGGSDPFIVLKDADMDRAVETGLTAKMFACGQACTAGKRFIIEESVYDEFLARFTKGLKKLKPGDPMDMKTGYGPMVSEQARDRLLGTVQHAVEQGAKLEMGGEKGDLPGAWLKPTVLAGITKDMDVYDKEVFGPVALFFKAKNADDAVRIANDSPFGLGSAIMTEDIDKAKAMASHLETGMTFINSFTISEPYWPFGGIKHSGFGRELGHGAIKEFVNKKLVRVAD